MALHSGIDTVAVVTGGVYTKTYGSSSLDNICNLFASYGLLESAPNTLIKIINIVDYLFKQRRL